MLSYVVLKQRIEVSQGIDCVLRQLLQTTYEETANHVFITWPVTSQAWLEVNGRRNIKGNSLAELLLGWEFEAKQINKFFELCGAPDELNWPGVSKLPWYNNFKPPKSMKRRVRDKFKQGFQRRTHLMLSIFGMIPYRAIPRVYQNMNPLTSSRRRKSANSNLNMKKRQSDRSYMIHSMHTYLQASRLGACVLSSGLDQTSQHIISNPLGLLDLVTIMESPGDLLEDQAGAHQVEILVEDTILVVEVIMEVTVVAHTLLKGEELHMLQVVCLVKVPEAVVVVMESVPQIIPKVVYTELQMADEAQI